MNLLLVSIPAAIAAVASIYIAKLTRDVRSNQDTGNQRRLGETVHDIAQTVEILAAQIHTNTRETLETRQHALDTREQVEDWIRASTLVHEELLRRLPPQEEEP
jgi:hypothetical protein